MSIPRGKLIKSDDKTIMKILTVESYPWLNFTDSDIVMPDNDRQSIVLTRYHDSKIIEEKVTEPQHFKNLLIPKTKPNVPTDLTKDFIISQQDLLVKRKRRMLDDDEAISLELSELTVAGFDNDDNGDSWLKKQERKIKEKTAFAQGNQAPHEESEEAHSKEEGLDDLQQEPLSQGAAKEAQSAQVEQNVKMPAPMEVEPSSAKMPAPTEVEPILAKEQDAPAEELLPEKSSQENLEKEAAPSAQLPQDAQEEQQQNQAAEEEKEGFAKGFLQGKEQGMQEAQEKSQEYFKKLEGSLEQIEKVKETALHDGQHIFIEIVKLCSEKILREHLKQDDEVLQKIFNTTLQDYLNSSNVKVEMHPDDLKRIGEHPNLKNVIFKENSSLEPGNFKIESDTGVTIIDLKKGIETLIDTLKTELFKK